MGQGSCRAKAQRHRRECSLSLPGEGRVGPGTHSGWVRPGFSLSCRRRARLHGRRRAEAERRRRGSSLSQPGKARIGPGAHLGGILQRLSLRAQSCMGVAGPKPSKAGVGSASPRPLAKPGSVRGREPTRVGSCPESACAAEGAPACKDVAWPKPSVAGGASLQAKPWSGRERTRVGPAQIQPSRPKARNVVSPGRSRATQLGKARVGQGAH